MSEEKRQYYPAFLKEFRDRPFDRKALGQAYYDSLVAGKDWDDEDITEYFRQFSLDDAHWNFHQRILHDEVLFRLLSEGYIHPTIHAVGAIYNDQEFYAFVFPFIHTAILKKLGEAVSTDNLEAIKLLEQWIEPFGTLFNDALYRMIEFTAVHLMKELEEIRLRRKTLPFDVYARISPAMMHLLNRLPDRMLALRDQFGALVLEFAVWQRVEMKVYSQPIGLLTRLKLLNMRGELHARRTAQLAEWEKQKEEAGKERFSVNHLIWIVPLVLILAFIVWRQTDYGKTYEDIAEEHAAELDVQQKALDDKQTKINEQMAGIDLNQLVTEELLKVAPTGIHPSGPLDPAKDPNRLDNGDLVYGAWLKIGREAYLAQKSSLNVSNETSYDMVVFLRQEFSPFMERAFYIRSGRSIVVYDNTRRNYSMRIYAGAGWTDTLVTPDFTQKLLKAGVPEETRDQFPASSELHGKFLFTVKSLEENLQPVSTNGKAAYVDPDNVPVIRLIDNAGKVEFAPQQ